MKHRNRRLTREEVNAILTAFRGGQKTVGEICREFQIYPKDLKRIVEAAGYGY